MINDVSAVQSTGVVLCDQNSEKPSKDIAIRRLLGLVASYVAGYLFVKVFDGILPTYWINIVLASLVIVWNEGIMVRQKLENKYIIKRGNLIETRFWEGILIALAFLGQYSFDSGLTFFFEICTVIYMSMCATGHLLREETSVYFVLDAFKGAVNKPLHAIGSRAQAWSYFIRYMRMRKGENKSEKNAYGYIMGIVMVLVAIPVFIVVLFILADIDEGFEEFTVDFLNSIVRMICRSNISFGNIILSIPCGLYIHNIIEGKLDSSPDAEREKEISLNNSIKDKHIVPFGFIIGIVSVFMITYVIFIAFQASNLFSVFYGVVPGTLTAANYAREGFFELCRVMVINLGIMAAISVFSHKNIYESMAMKITGVAFMTVSLMFSVISVAKLYLYINRFGFTSARFTSLWAAITLGGGCIAIILNLIARRKTAKIWLMFAASSYIFINIFTFLMYKI